MSKNYFFLKLFVNIFLYFLYTIIFIVIWNFVYWAFITFVLKENVPWAYDFSHIKIAVISSVFILIFTLVLRKFFYLPLFRNKKWN